MPPSCVTAARLPRWSDGRCPICLSTRSGRHSWSSSSRRCSATAEALVRQQDAAVHPGSVLIRLRTEERRAVLVLDQEEAEVAAQTDVACRIPLQATPGVPREVRLVVDDPE